MVCSWQQSLHPPPMFSFLIHVIFNPCRPTTEELKRQTAALDDAQSELSSIQNQLAQARAEIETIKEVATVSENTKQEAIDQVRSQWQEEVASLQAIMKGTAVSFLFFFFHPFVILGFYVLLFFFFCGLMTLAVRVGVSVINRIKSKYFLHIWLENEAETQPSFILFTAVVFLL